MLTGEPSRNFKRSLSTRLSFPTARFGRDLSFRRHLYCVALGAGPERCHEGNTKYHAVVAGRACRGDSWYCSGRLESLCAQVWLESLPCGFDGGTRMERAAGLPPADRSRKSLSAS